MRNKLKTIFVFFCFIHIFSSCVTNRQTDFLQNIPKDYPTVDPEEYKIIPGDQIAITVYALDKETASLFQAYTPRYTSLTSVDATARSSWNRTGDNSVGVRPVNVYADGSINFPYLGRIYVENLTLFEARKVISEKLEAFAEGTSAEVALANRYFSILGEAGAQRILMPNTNMTIYQALSTTNTIPTFGDRSKVSVIRQTKDGSIMKTFDLRSKDIIDSEYYYIQPNDVIYFPQMKRKFFGGTDTFAGVFSLVTVFTSIVIYAAKLF